MSPYSISQALGLLFNGADSSSTSSHQLAQHVFGISEAKETNDAGTTRKLVINDGLLDLSSRLSPPVTTTTTNNNNNSVIFYQANSIWVAPRYTLQAKYKNIAEKTFPNSMVAPIATAAIINQWVSAATQDKIKDMVTEDALSTATLILINALYFKGIWEKPFEKNDTGPFAFTPFNGRQYDAAMMYLAKTSGDSPIRAAMFPSSDGTGKTSSEVQCVAISIPYQGNQYSAILSMPYGDVHYDEQQKKLVLTESGEEYAQALNTCRFVLIRDLAVGLGDNDDDDDAPSGQQQKEKLVNLKPVGGALKLYLPRFEVEYSVSLNTALQAVGITAPFAPTQGDFSQMVETTGDSSNNGGGGRVVSDLYVSDVIHKVFVKVDEQGTEAAAATAVIMMRSAMPRMDNEELFVKLDRPFVFSVVNNETGVILFVGEVNAPEKWNGR